MLPLAFSNKRFAQSIHKYPQCFSQITLALISRCSYYAHQIDREEKNFTSQFKDGSKGKTERSLSS